MKPSESSGQGGAGGRKPAVRAVGPGLRWVLVVALGLFAVLMANSVYLYAVTILEWLNGVSYQNYFYQLMFLAHLGLGLVLVVPFVWFTVVHLRNTWRRTNRRAIFAGWLLFILSAVLLLSGVVLMRVGGIELKDPTARAITYWLHVLATVFTIWLYVLHRVAGTRIRWRVGLAWSGVALALGVVMFVMHGHDPRKAHAVYPKTGKQYFHPSSARTTTGTFIPANTMMMDKYCQECHADAYEGWFHSTHHFSSFNNPPYLFSVKETREVALRRDGSVQAARWCAGCHDPVPFFSGAFDDPAFDLVNHPTAQAGITCTACHSIVALNSVTGNGDYLIEEPVHYPFATSTNAFLAYLNRQLVKAKPEFHKQTFLKPVHRTAEFCSACHKVSIPRELNHYKDWLRGQNSYDSYLLSGVSGHGARSFYYPERATTNCAGCHMPLQASADFGAQIFSPTNRVLSIHDHLFPGANTAIADLRGASNIVSRHQAFMTNTVRIDLFAVKDGGTVDSPLAVVRPRIPALRPGRTYLFEVVLRTLKVGHQLTQGTTDSNELWVDARAESGGRVIGRSGGLGTHREVDPWSHFINTYMLDKDGNRIDRRNPQDIFTPLYNHQINPGSAQVVHYTLTVPPDVTAPITVEVKFQYRKFDAIYMNFVQGTNYASGAPLTLTNQLPITTLASDRVTFPIARDDGGTESAGESPIPAWQRWNDYGIALFLEGDKGSEKGELIQAEQAFREVEKLGRWDGPANLARVYFKEGRLEDAVAALQRAARSTPPAPRWLVGWLNGLVNKQNGFLDQAIAEFRSILDDHYPELQTRGFDFSKDYEVLNELGQTLFERAKAERADPAAQKRLLEEAAGRFEQTLALDPENLAAHYNLALIRRQLGDEAAAAEHQRLHERYRPDDNARDRAIAAERRRNPAADHAAQAIVIYSLQRPGAPELTSGSTRPTITAHR